MYVPDVLEQTISYLKKYIELVEDVEEIEKIESNIEYIKYHINIIK